MLNWTSRKHPFRDGRADGSTVRILPAEVNGARGQAEEDQPEETLPGDELLLLVKVFLFFLAGAGIALLIGYVALTSLPPAQP